MGSMSNHVVEVNKVNTSSNFQNVVPRKSTMVEIDLNIPPIYDIVTILKSTICLIFWRVPLSLSLEANNVHFHVIR